MGNIRDLLKKTLVETPIGDIDLMTPDNKGNVSKEPAAFLKRNSSFGKRDEVSKKILTSPKGIDKIRKKFANTQATFDLVFYNGKEGSKYTEYGVMTAEQVKKNLKIDVASKKEVITIVFVGNVATLRQQMTSWIIAHRLGHAIYADARRSNDTWHPWYRYTDSLADCFDKAGEAYGSRLRFSKPASILLDNKQEPLFKALAETICTFKSARDKQLLRPYETWHEILAQYLTSTPMFNELPPSITYRSGTANSTRRIQDADLKEIADMYFIDQVRYNLPDHIENLMEHYKGKILVM